MSKIIMIVIVALTAACGTANSIESQVAYRYTPSIPRTISVYQPSPRFINYGDSVAVRLPPAGIDYSGQPTIVTQVNTICDNSLGWRYELDCMLATELGSDCCFEIMSVRINFPRFEEGGSVMCEDKLVSEYQPVTIKT